MSKELQALEEIRYLVIFDEDCVDEDGETKPIKVFVDEICPKQYKTIENALKDKEQQDQIIKTIKEFAPLITISIKGKEYDIKANNTSDTALYAELYINDRLIYSTMNRDKIEKLALLKEVLL